MQSLISGSLSISFWKFSEMKMPEIYRHRSRGIDGNIFSRRSSMLQPGRLFCMSKHADRGRSRKQSLAPTNEWIWRWTFAEMTKCSARERACDGMGGGYSGVSGTFSVFLYELPGNQHSKHPQCHTSLSSPQFIHQSLEARAEVWQYGWVEW